jgi:hypothetical protein
MSRFQLDASPVQMPDCLHTALNQLHHRRGRDFVICAAIPSPRTHWTRSRPSTRVISGSERAGPPCSVTCSRQRLQMAQVSPFPIRHVSRLWRRCMYVVGRETEEKSKISRMPRIQPTVHSKADKWGRGFLANCAEGRARKGMGSVWAI